MIFPLVCSVIILVGSVKAQDSSKDPLTLDKTTDVIGGWKSVVSGPACFYSDYITDFEYGWGCGGPTNDKDFNGTTGYWTSCNVKECHLTYFDRPFKPNIILVKAIIQGDAKIIVTSKSDPTSADSDVIRTIDSGINGMFNGEVTIDLFESLDAKVIDFAVQSSTRGNGYALVDKIILSSTHLPGNDSSKSASTISVIPTISMLLSFILAQIMK